MKRQPGCLPDWTETVYVLYIDVLYTRYTWKKIYISAMDGSSEHCMILSGGVFLTKRNEPEIV